MTADTLRSEAARVKADAAAVRMAADLSGLLVRLRKARLVREDDLKRALVDVLDETDVELALPARAVLVLHTLCNRVVAAEVHAPAADTPQEHLDAALSITVVCLGECRAAQLRLVYGHKTVFTLDRDFERALRAFFIWRWPQTPKGINARSSAGRFLIWYSMPKYCIAVLTAAFWLPLPRRR